MPEQNGTALRPVRDDKLTRSSARDAGVATAGASSPSFPRVAALVCGRDSDYKLAMLNRLGQWIARQPGRIVSVWLALVVGAVAWSVGWSPPSPGDLGSFLPEDAEPPLDFYDALMTKYRPLMEPFYEDAN